MGINPEFYSRVWLMPAGPLVRACRAEAHLFSIYMAILVRIRTKRDPKRIARGGLRSQAGV
jgi:hypothetical protein